MTLSDLAAPVLHDSTLTTHGEWKNSEHNVTKLPPCTPNKLSDRLEAKSKMRLSMQMARLRTKLPPEEKSPLTIRLPPALPTKLKPDIQTTATEETATQTAISRTPPPPCSAFDESEDRRLVISLINVNDNEYDKQQQPVAIKEKTRNRFISGWNFDIKHLKSVEKSVDGMTVYTAKNPQKRCSTTSGTTTSDTKLKFNLYDRYTATSVSGTFKFFHYSDLRLYIKQYRRNHSCGAGQRSYTNTTASPVCELGLYRLDNYDDRLPNYYKAKRSRDGFVLGVQSNAVTPNVWKANVNLPLPSAFRQRVSRKQQDDEPIMTPSVFVRQNGAFSQFWKTKEDGTPDPSIAVTRPPTTQQSQRPMYTDENKENMNEKQDTGRESPDNPNSLGEPKMETSTWRIMKMIASCSIHSRTDGSDLTMTSECRSPTSATDSNPVLKKSQNIGETISDSLTNEITDVTEMGHDDAIENQVLRLQNTYNLLTKAHNERPVMYNRTRSILSNMSNLLNYYIDSETLSHNQAQTNVQMDSNEIVEAELKEKSENIHITKQDEVQRNQLVQLRKDLRNLASRRSPSLQKISPQQDATNMGSLVLSGNKNYDRNRPTRCSTTNVGARRTPTKEMRNTTPSPARFGQAGYRKVLLSVEQKDDDRPILFVSRSHLLPTVSASVGAMKSRQIMLHRRTTHPADAKQFTKITDLLRGNRHIQDASKDRSVNTANGRRVTVRTKSLPGGRIIQM